MRWLVLLFALSTAAADESRILDLELTVQQLENRITELEEELRNLSARCDRGPILETGTALDTDTTPTRLIIGHCADDCGPCHKWKSKGWQEIRDATGYDVRHKQHATIKEEPDKSWPWFEIWDESGNRHVVDDRMLTVDVFLEVTK